MIKLAFQALLLGLIILSLSVVNVCKDLEIQYIEGHSAAPDGTILLEYEPSDYDVDISQIPESCNLPVREFENVEAVYSPEPVEVVTAAQTYAAGVTLTDAEKQEFAALVFLEAGGESYACQKGVASVVINRMITGKKTFSQVVYAPNQFTPASRIPYTTPSQSCIDAVNDVLNNGTSLPLYVTYFRANYYFDWCEPYTSIDRTYFSYSASLKSSLGL